MPSITVSQQTARFKALTAIACLQFFYVIGFMMILSSLVFIASERYGLSSTEALAISASFSAFNFGLHLLGGYLGGRLISFRRLFLLCLFFQLVGGCFLISSAVWAFYWGISIFLAGSGFSAVSLNNMISQLFEAHDQQRDNAFLWNYSIMNMGFLIGGLLAGVLIKHDDVLFAVVVVSNVLAIAIQLITWRYLKTATTASISGLVWLKKQPGKRLTFSVLVSTVVVLLLYELMHHAQLSYYLVLGLGSVMFAIAIVLALRYPDKIFREKLGVFVILSVVAVIFFTIYQLLFTGLNLFIKNNVDRMVAHFILPPQWFLSIDPFIIVIGGPLLSWGINRLRKKGINVSIPLLFCIGLFACGVGTGLLAMGTHFANHQGYVALAWVLVSYCFFPIGELCISPMGYAMVGLLIPEKLRSLAMGFNLMLTGVAAYIANFFSHLALPSQLAGIHFNRLLVDASYLSIFISLTIVTLGVAILLLIFLPFLNKRLLSH